MLIPLLLAVAVILLLSLLLLTNYDWPVAGRQSSPPPSAVVDDVGGEKPEATAAAPTVETPSAPPPPERSRPEVQPAKVASTPPAAPIKRNPAVVTRAKTPETVATDAQAESAQNSRQEHLQMREEFLEIKRRIESQNTAPKLAGPQPAPLPSTTPTQSREMPAATAEPLRASLPSDNPPSAQLRARLPEITINALAYSEQPERRFIRLNGDKLRQGERHDNGLLVEEIRPDGVLFRYQSERFFHSAFGN